MKKSILSILSLIAVFGFTFNSVQAQEKRDMTVQIEVTENGETKVIERVIEGDSGQTLDQILKELDVLDGMDLNGSGERVEIKVKKSIDGDLDIDRDYDVKMFGKNGCEDKMMFSTDQGFLGVYITGTDGNGARVTQVIEESAAFSGGIQENDVITSINGKAISSEGELIEAVGSYKAGETVEVGFERSGESHSVSTELGQRTMRMGGHRQMMFKHFGENEDMDREIMEILEDHGYNDMDRIIERRINKIKKVHGNPDGAFLGISASQTCGDVESKGAKISHVYDNSTAMEMGLQEGDVIQSINGKSIQSFGDVVKAMENAEPGQEIDIEVDRNGEVVTANGSLKKRSDVLPTEKRSHCSDPRTQSGPWAPEVYKEVEIRIELAECTKEEEDMLQEKANVDFEEQLPINNLEFSPNPSNGQFNLQFELSDQADTRILVFDNSGRQVYDQVLKDFEGSFNQQIDITDQPAGVYFMMVAQGEKQFTRKIVKQ